jgi:hypothetical protein
LSGCFLSDSRGDNTKWQFPQDTILQPGAFLVVWEEVLGFNLSTGGSDVIMFTAPDSTTGLDFYDFGPEQPDWSEGRYPDGGSVWRHFKPNTRGESNTSGAVVEKSLDLTKPETIELEQNYPNPFNPATTLAYSLPKSGQVVLEIYNIFGQKVRTLVNLQQPAGIYRMVWNSDDEYGRLVSAGLYLYSLRVDNQLIASKKMVLVK